MLENIAERKNFSEILFDITQKIFPQYLLPCYIPGFKNDKHNSNLSSKSYACQLYRINRVSMIMQLTQIIHNGDLRYKPWNMLFYLGKVRICRLCCVGVAPILYVMLRWPFLLRKASSLAVML